MPEIRRLYDLQGVDLELDWRNARLAEIKTAIGDQTSLTPLRIESRTAKSELDAAAANQHDLDQIIGSFDARVAEADSKLYSGAVKLARELTDLQSEIDMLKRQRGEQEDLLLVVLDEVDAAQERFKIASAVLNEAKQTWDSDQASIIQEQGKLQAEIGTLTVDRAARVREVTPVDFALYEQVRKARKGKAIALLHGSTCDSCKVGIPNRQVQEARSSEKVVRCPNCGLILLME
jgi:predicted  nucleic acid-binding Zn-ribbon protein